MGLLCVATAVLNSLLIEENLPPAPFSQEKKNSDVQRANFFDVVVIQLVNCNVTLKNKLNAESTAAN